jgi:hypothetical protein
MGVLRIYETPKGKLIIYQTGGIHLPASKKKTKPVLSHAAMELLKTFQNTTWQLSKTSGAFENIPEHYMETFQNTGCMHGHPCTKNKTWYSIGWTETIAS